MHLKCTYLIFQICIVWVLLKNFAHPYGDFVETFPCMFHLLGIFWCAIKRHHKFKVVIRNVQNVRVVMPEFLKKKKCCHFLLGLKGMHVRFASQNTSCPEASSFILFYSSQWNFFFNVVSRVWSLILIIRSWFLFKPLLMREKEFCSFQFWYVIFSLF